jgi:hypothetical protein
LIVTIHQPDFLPWLGFFNKVSLSDTLVIADHVQYRDDGFQNRNKIKTSQGPQWLTIPIIRDSGQPIFKVKVSTAKKSGKSWSDLHLLTIQRNYARAPFYEQYIGLFQEIYSRPYELLADYNVEFIQTALNILGIQHVKILRTQQMNLQESKTGSVIEICKLVGGDKYISGIRGTRYLDEKSLDENGIKLLYNHYDHPTYNQQFMKFGFVPSMSIIDLLFNHGPESLKILKSGFRGFELDPIKEAAR